MHATLHIFWCIEKDCPNKINLLDTETPGMYLSDGTTILCMRRCAFQTIPSIPRFSCVSPRNNSLYNLLKRAVTEAVTTDALKEIETIVPRCESCQRIRNAPMRFRVSMSYEDVRINTKLYVDIMCCT